MGSCDIKEGGITMGTEESDGRSPGEEFDSWRSFWDFQREVAHSWRYVRSTEGQRFLAAIAIGSRSRAAELAAGRHFYRAQVAYHDALDAEAGETFPGPALPERHCLDDYVIMIPRTKFYAILRVQHQIDPSELESLLANRPSDYATNTNAFGRDVAEVTRNGHGRQSRCHRLISGDHNQADHLLQRDAAALIGSRATRTYREERGMRASHSSTVPQMAQ
jgi:hypothetical protein